MSKNIMVIDDEENIRELIKFNLEKEGYKVWMACDGKEGLDKLTEEVDLIILDLMLPGIDGFDVCREIRNNSKYNNIPIIMLTAKGEEIDKIVGLEIGADDYMVKPFSPRELLARIKAIFRRIEKNDLNKKNQEGILDLGGIKLNIKSHEVTINENEIELTPKEFQLLKYLMINKNNVLSRDMLLEKIWDYSYSGDTRTVDVHIRRLRKKLDINCIKTVRGVGYKFVEME